MDNWAGCDFTLRQCTPIKQRGTVIQFAGCGRGVAAKKSTCLIRLAQNRHASRPCNVAVQTDCFAAP